MYLSELANLPGVSGNEDAVRRYIRKKMEPYCERFEVDSMGNLLACQKGWQPGRKTLMLCAHMDEVGLIVSRITDEGFLKFKTVGGIDPRVLVSKRVLVGKEGHAGVIGRRAIHLLSPEERKKAPKIKELYIDVGVKNKKEAEKIAAVGDYVVFDSAYVPFGEGLVKAKALDDRAGCSVLLSAASVTGNVNVCFAFSVQEEVGLRGARLCARRVKPDLALVIDVTTCSDLPGTDAPMRSTLLGKGAALSFIDGATSYNRELVQRLYQMAKNHHVPIQFKQIAAGGNDAGTIHVAAGGILTAALSLPGRYIHSPSSVISLNDYEAAKEFVRILIQEAEHV